MTDQVLLLSGSVLTIIWGIAHLFPTRNVVRDFGEISTDNKNILTMEWIIEGVTLIFAGILTGMLTILDHQDEISRLVFILISAFLVVLAIISLFTGFRVNFLPYKLCPVILIVSAVLILIGGVIL